MLVICSNCEVRLQLDESKIPSQAFKVRCPKCQAAIEVKSPTPDADAGAMTFPPEMTPPAPAVSSAFQRPIVAAPFKPADDTQAEAPSQDDSASISQIAKLLATALRQHEPLAAKPSAERGPWSRRKALVCTNPENREAIAKGLVAHDYDVFVAEGTEEALGRMREDRIDVLILETNFDPVEQGYAFVTREVKLMRPSERRRLFLIYITQSARTMDLHAAFLHNANLIVNPADVERLPDALEVSIRHYNELYRDFNHALEMPAI
jgi:predicted Zn finger-like uncharacterized protein